MPVCFVVLNPDVLPSDRLEAELIDLVSDHLGKALRPKNLYFVPDLPKTRTAKVMRRVIKAAFLGRELGDLTALENPEAVEPLKNLA